MLVKQTDEENHVKVKNKSMVYSFHWSDQTNMRRHFTSSFQFQPGSDRLRQQERMYRKDKTRNHMQICNKETPKHGEKQM